MRPQPEQVRKAEALWSELGPAVGRTLLSYERDPDLRQDLAQDVFLALLASVERIERASNQRAYVLRIAHNVAVNHVARETRRGWVELDDDIADVRDDPARRASAAHERDRLLEAIRGLALPYRQVLVLVLEDLEPIEIADVLGIRSGTVRVRLNRARHMLREVLRDG